MMRLFQRYFIGGCSGSREGTWFLVVTLLIVPFWVVVAAELNGIAMETTSGMLLVIGPAVLVAWGTAHGLEKAAREKWIKPRSVEGPDVPLPE